MNSAKQTELQKRVSGLLRALKEPGGLGSLYHRFKNHLAQRLLLSLSITHGNKSGMQKSDGLPLPPPFLREWVAGTDDLEWFLESGKRGVQTIQSILQKHNIAFADLGSVLDFGCGCGRVLRHLHRYTSVHLHGSDINRSAITWCDENLDFAEFGTNRLAPPTRYRPGSFGLIYAFSVFSHLTEPLQSAWIREMHRILKTGGYLLMTVHGDYYLEEIPEAQRADYKQGKLVVKGDKSAGRNACAAYHPEQYVRNVLAREAGFEVIDFIPQGGLGNPYQDAYLLQA